MSVPNGAPYPPHALPPQTPPTRSPWPWIGIGCGALALLTACAFLIIAIVLLGGLGSFSTSP